jgi:hypothetical protein
MDLIVEDLVANVSLINLDKLNLAWWPKFRLELVVNKLAVADFKTGKIDATIIILPLLYQG